jgi:large subunit ribosomal protein L35
MPKLKTNKAAAARFKFTATGKIKFTRVNRQHQPTLKKTKRKRHLRRPGLIDKSDAGRVKELLPYAGR